MIAPVILLVLMTAPYLAVRFVFTNRGYDLRGAAAIGLTLLFIFTGIGHFVQTEPMSQMLPAWVPARVLIIYLTGLLELALAAGFALPKFRPRAGWAAAIMLVAIFPANIHAALNRVPMGGHEWGPAYLLIRGPLQAIFLFWIYWFTIRKS